MPLTALLNLKLFCNTNCMPQFDLSRPWRQNENIFATDGAILFIGRAREFPDVMYPDKTVPDIKKFLGFMMPLGINKVVGYSPVSAREIESLLADIQPAKESIYERIECVKCAGKGIVSCECFDCGHEHEKLCSDCKGEGYIKSDIVIEEKYIRTPVQFRGVAINYKYLSLIKESMDFLGGEWEVFVRGELEIVVFQNSSTAIAVMPIRVTLG